MPKRRCDTPTNTSAVTAAHQLLSSAMRSSDDNDRPVHSLMLSFHDLHGRPLRRLQATVQAHPRVWLGVLAWETQSLSSRCHNNCQSLLAFVVIRHGQVSRSSVGGQSKPKMTRYC